MNAEQVEAGHLGDQYFVSGVAALADNIPGIKDLYVTKEMNEQGLFLMTVNVMGMPFICEIDDELPMLMKDYLLFAN